ncbi:DUF397 domain-containing protein [Nocardia bovistercoris]|uniref:DUF397 domain-containing protein n=1 Tax=Nocardia bovistercoris TaxID=2785916 RepID=A0A931IC42_9NOCA|nr:DUF397 domain-containing protein [Nocardia bovistercoris]
MSNSPKINDSTWTKSTFSDHGNACVEVRIHNDTVLIRDSKFAGDPSLQPIIAVPVALWSDFLSTVSDDSSGAGRTELGIPRVEHDPATGTTTLIDAVETTLVYTAEEWRAFLDGVRHDQFALA